MSEPRELLCMKCGSEHPVWYADNNLWNRTVRRPDGSDEYPFLCPTCFTRLAEERGVATMFRVCEPTPDADWRPIATAPRDGTEIVCWLGGPSMALVEDDEHRLRILRWSTSYSIFGLGGNWTDGLCTLGDRIDVTHWMPLPTAPGVSAN